MICNDGDSDQNYVDVSEVSENTPEAPVFPVLPSNTGQFSVTAKEVYVQSNIKWTSDRCVENDIFVLYLRQLSFTTFQVCLKSSLCKKEKKREKETKMPNITKEFYFSILCFKILKKQKQN